jgi:hypothetical protein
MHRTHGTRHRAVVTPHHALSFAAFITAVSLLLTLLCTRAAHGFPF